MLKRVIFILILLMAVPVLAQAAWIDPGFRFKTIRTDHFDVHYHQGLEEFAAKAAGYAEEAYCDLGETFGWRPVERTHLVLVDSSDLANGFTTVLPYNMMFVYMVPPLPDMTIGEYDNWLRMVVFHEYAHVATMDASRGFNMLMRKIFGKTLPGMDIASVTLFFLSVPPNVLMPNWWLEGMATYTETAYTTRGRGRSAYYEMIFRKAAEDNSFLHISRINGDIPYWPGRSTPYMYGLAMMRHIARNYGEDAFSEINMGHAGRFPYAINAVPRRSTGKQYPELYQDATDEIYREQQDKLATLRSIPLTEFEVLDIKGERLYYPRVSPNGKLLAFERHDPHGHGGIVILDAERLEELDFIRRLPSDMTLTWGPDSNTLCYTQADLRGGYNLYQDLYCYDVENGDADRITKNQRVKDPAISPDGKKIAVVKVSAQGQALALIDASKKRPETEVLEDFPAMRVSSPGWSPDGTRIVYSVRDSSGNTGLRIHDIHSGADEGIYLSNRGADLPTWSPDGEHIIFTSYQTGVFNVFALRLDDRTLFQVTNLTGGAFYPEATPDGRILFSSYHSGGFNIARMDYRPMEWSTSIGPIIEPYWPERESSLHASQCALQGDAVSSAPPEARPYNAFRSVWPRFWLPTLRADHMDVVPGAFTAGQDVLGYHSYWVDAGIGRSEQGYYDAAYVYNRWYPVFWLSAYSRPIVFTEYGPDDEDVWQRWSGATAALSFPYQRLETWAILHLGYHLRKDRHLDGEEDLLFTGRKDSSFAALEFTNALRYPFSISREEGRTLMLEYRDFNRDRNSDYQASEYWLTYDEYIGLPGHHVLYYQIKGAAYEGEDIYAPVFLFGGNPGVSYDFPVRGYPSGYRTGKYAATATLEHRFPVWYPLKGPNTKPLFFDRMHVAGFVDAGVTWNEKDKVTHKDVDVGVGTELRMDVVMGYKFKVTPALGVAFGLDEGGVSQIYFTVYAPF